MKYNTLVSSALVAFTVLAGLPARADNMASIAITPATGVVTLAPRWGIGGNLAGFHQMSQDLGLGGAANNFYSIKSTAIPAGGDIAAFTLYTAASGAATNHADIGSKLTPSSYSALTSADPDVGYGSVNFYLIHHKGTTDYFTAIIPGSAVSSAVTDEKPMSGPGGPGTVTGVSGYFGLTFAASNLGYGLNQFYYLRTDPATGLTKFGTLAPALLGTSADQFDLGIGGHNALAFTGSDVGFGTNKMYYLRLDPVTGFTILGMLDPALAGVRHTSDIANLGSVYTTLTFVPGDLGFGSGQFYTTGAVNPTWQSVSFAAIADKSVGQQFTVTPSASSALPITLTVVSGSVGTATIGTPVGGVFTITTTAPGVITLEAKQAGNGTTVESNLLRQRFTISAGATTQSITFASIPNHTVGDAPFTVSPTASSGLAVTVAVTSGPATVSGNTVTLTGAGTVTLQATQAGSATFATATPVSQTFTVAAGSSGTAPVVTLPPANQATTAGNPVIFTVAATGTPAPTIQWTLNGAVIAGATNPTLTIPSAQLANVGIYRATITNSSGSIESAPAILGLTSTSKVTGSATEVGSNILHPNGNIYDQVLLTGAAASMTADAGQVLRVSFVDLSNDIVQVEFNGPGTLSIVLDGASGPAIAQNYNQPSVSYMKGNARIVIAGANESTNITVFSVGRITAINQALFRSDVTYDGVADIASVAILSTNGKFGGLRTANASYFATTGYTGVDASGVQFTGPVFIGDINASDTATPAIMIGSAGGVTQINGGDLLQTNGRAIQVSSLTQVRLVAGTNSNGGAMPVQANRGRFEQNGTDVTAQVLVP